MELYELLNKAIILATTYHKGQVDKSGQPYILHPLWVMSNVESLKGKIVAILHDTIEDTQLTISDLINHGFCDDIVKAIDILTKKKNQKYDDYIELVSKNDLAKEVKIEDLNHNMDLNRLKEVTEKDVKRYLKYVKAYNYLLGQ